MARYDDKRLFDAVRQIKEQANGQGLTNEEVAMVNRAIINDVVDAANGMKVSQRCVEHMHSFESCRLRAYPDPGSKDGKPWTIGWGATGAGIGPGTVWTQAQADERYAADLARFEIGVNMLLQGAPTTQGQFDALVSFAYNVGLDIDEDKLAEGLGDSTLLRLHLEGNYAAAAEQFAAWNKNDGKVMAGLVKRRAAEAALYAS